MEKRTKHEEKYCPRCGNVFECRVGNILNCQCYGVELTTEVTAHISREYDECLCRACLLEMSERIRGSDKINKG
ncbi:MAG: cysteine-rich CWC family protein [Bacteroidetes bacterium]|jgi:hypothetical protein|nr:cysteine-rich CWC family protein [Bacteroidota bacterium]